MAGLGDLWRLATKVDRLFALEEKHGAAISALEREVVTLAERISRLEAREDVVIAEAKGAASHAAFTATTTVVSDLSRRIGMLEANPTPRPARKRLPKTETPKGT